MSCARIHPSLFDGDAARQHTAHSVDALVQSKSYAAYTRHCRYRERLFLLWFIAPIAVALVLGYHMVVFGAMDSTDIVYNMHSGRRMRYGGCGGGVSAMRALQRSVRDVHLVDLDRKQQQLQQQQHNNSSNKGWDDVVALLQTSRHMHKIMYDEVPGLGYVTMALALYVLPCVMVLPYISFFDDEPVSRRSSRRHLLYATAVSALMCAAGGTWWHAPPFALAQPSLLPLLRSALSSTTSMSTSRTALVCRVLGMVALRTTVTQGLLIASYAVSRWQRSFWRRAWHVPLPLLTVPLLVGVVGAVCACLALPFVATLSAHSAHARTASPSLPTMLTVVERLRTALWLRQRDDVEHAVAWVGQQLAQHIALSTAYAQLVLRGVLTYPLYVAALQMTLLHVVVLTRGVVLYMLGGLLRLLPTQPTLWTLCTLAAAGAVAVQLFSGSSSSSSSNNTTSYSGNDHSGGDARNVNTSSNVNMDALVTPYGLTTLAILVALLYNGFVA